jgi:pyridoxamine 5'-phosphate oxidase family protein
VVMPSIRCEWLSLRGSVLMTPGATMRAMVFSSNELEFLRSQRIGRFATVGPSGWPHVVPVMYAIDDAGSLEFDVDGVKLRNLQAEPRAAMVVDAMGPKRGVAVQGRVELIAPERARLLPVHKFSWGL